MEITLLRPKLRPAFDLAEREMLEQWLEHHRRTLEFKCVGLTEEQLAMRSVPPSTLSLGGLLRHMAEVERFWFREVFAGEELDVLYCAEENPDADFFEAAAENAEQGHLTWRAECASAESIAARASLDDRSVKARREEHPAMRWILVHMIEEYARHNGHADLLREAIDGATGY